jgi:uncharacterized protein (DUF1501 family)
MKRRSFLKTVPIGVAATAVPFMLGSRRAEALTNSPLLSALTNSADDNGRVLVLIYLEGGNDGLNTVVPLEDPLYDLHRKNLGFTTPDEKARLKFMVRPDLGINPYATAFEPLWNEGKVAIVQNVGIENPDLSHFRGLEIWNSSSDADLIIPTGWAGRYLETLYPDYPDNLPEDPVAINMGTLGSQIFRGSHSMMDVQVPDPLTFSPAGKNGTSAVPNTYGGAELAYVRSLVNITNVYSSRFHSLFPEKAVSKVQYPNTVFAQDLQHIAWCVNAGLKTKIYFANLQGFDTHFGQLSKDDSSGGGHAFLLRTLFEAIYAFQRDLEAMGNADRVVTMTYSEFGRRTGEVGDFSSGTDHGSAAPHFVIGTNVNGELYGHHPDLEHLDKNGDLVNDFEFRQMYAAVLGDWFGVDESLRTSILSPGRSRNPFDISFSIDNSSNSSHLINPFKSQLHDGQNTQVTIALSVSPNPASRHTTVFFTNPSNTSCSIVVEVFDDRGRSVQIRKVTVSQHDERVTIDTNSLPSGSYYIQVRAANISETVKFIVAH